MAWHGMAWHGMAQDGGQTYLGRIVLTLSLSEAIGVITFSLWLSPPRLLLYRLSCSPFTPPYFASLHILYYDVGLDDCWGEEFEKLYESYVERGKARRTFKARELWYAILDAQIETGDSHTHHLRDINLLHLIRYLQIYLLHLHVFYLSYLPCPPHLPILTFFLPISRPSRFKPRPFNMTICLRITATQARHICCTRTPVT